MTRASCNKCAGTRLGTTEVAIGAERQKQDVKRVAAVVVRLRVLWLPLSHLGDLFFFFFLSCLQVIFAKIRISMILRKIT